MSRKKAFVSTRRRSASTVSAAALPKSPQTSGDSVWEHFAVQLAAICALGLLLRLVHLFQTQTVPSTLHLIGDAKGYFQWAERIVGGEWYGRETFYQAPLYPYFIAVILKCFGSGVTAVRIVQVILGTVSIGLIGATTKSLFDRRSGLIAAVMLAVFPAAIYYDGLIQKTSLASFLLCLFLYWLTPLMGRPGGSPEEVKTDQPTGGTRPSGDVAGWKVIACGITLGCLMLVRENTLLWLPLPLIWIWLGRRDSVSRSQGDDWDGRTRTLFSALYCAGLLLVLFPVAARNASLGGEWSPTTFQAGPNFYIGNNRLANGVYSPLVPGHETPLHERSDAVRLAEQASGRELSAREVSRFYFQKTWQDIRSAPADWLTLLGIKSLMVVNYFEVPDVESMVVYRDYSVVLLMFDRLWHFGVLVALASAGLVLTIDQWRRLWLWYLLIVVLIVAIVGFFVLGRYRYPLVALMIPFAAAGISRTIQAVRSGQTGRLIAAATAALLTAVVCHLPVHDTGRFAASSFANLGAASAESGDMQQALSLFRRAASEAPSMPEVHVNLGRALLATGQPVNAVSELRLALALEPNLADVDYFLATALERTGDRQTALLHYRRAVALDPSNQRAAAALRRLGG
ncbi:glycosyltransferase family 39 protein [Stieleria sp. TO1_6]|uniref:tetratricopeptide repeat protein n=1 Tax=Stieleria tagensis TaxID=2956795 RepID=UPI00209B987E|nr:glycosyltransferase family 39 protein [Stieleria tagensis]MCO8122389.1 glycosyltransferase family 39 protein [Stieleria tagensis]